jgi:hypothetical protein
VNAGLIGACVIGVCGKANDGGDDTIGNVPICDGANNGVIPGNKGDIGDCADPLVSVRSVGMIFASLDDLSEAPPRITDVRV